MTKDSAAPVAQRSHRPVVIDPPASDLLDEPIEYLLADHSRQRCVCAALQQFAKEGWVHRAEWQSVATFLVHDRALHHLDEEGDLFPALRRRSMLEDNLEPLLVRLKKDHRRSDILVERIVALLSEHADSDPFPVSKAEAELIAAYATSELRHLAIENGVLLAIAQIRLNRKDLQKMSEAMKMRRGIQA